MEKGNKKGVIPSYGFFNILAKTCIIIAGALNTMKI